MLILADASVTLGERHFSFSLSAAPGDTVAILGESGSGKTTLLNLIGGFVPLQSGDISWNGQSITDLTPDRRPVTSLFQENNLFEHLSVAQNVGLGLNPGLKLGPAQWQQVTNTLKSVGLDDFDSRMPGSLSGGEQQRAGLARCLIRHKPILLLDEPYSALDVTTREKMLALTHTVCQQNDLCTVLVTHNPDDARILCARVIKLENGRLIE